MEKRTPHCNLQSIKTLIQDGRIRFTWSALEGAAALGIDADGITRVVMGLTVKDFYKSMTTHADHRIWQDVYHVTTSGGEIYLKLTVIDDVLVVSFKEL